VWYEFPLSRSLAEPLAAASVVGVVALVAALWRARVVAPIVSLAATWTLVALLPVSGLLPSSLVRVAERYLFVPSVGFCLALGWAFARVAGRERLPTWARACAVATLAGVLALWGGLSANRNRDWKTAETLLTADLRKQPASLKLNTMLGRYHFLNGRYEAAFAFFARVKRLDPANLDQELHVALLALGQGRGGEAIAMLDRAGLAASDVVDVRLVYGLAYQALGDAARARGSFEAAIRGRRTVGLFFKWQAEQALLRLAASGAPSG
jgi:tetratricopeptide (TPR) repeat protein